VKSHLNKRGDQDVVDGTAKNSAEAGVQASASAQEISTQANLSNNAIDPSTLQVSKPMISNSNSSIQAKDKSISRYDRSPSIDSTQAKDKDSGMSSPTKDIADPPELNAKKSHEIFSGFNSTLNRIEDLVKTDRDRSVGRSPSFNLGSLSNRSDNMGALTNRSESAASYRSSSSLSFRNFEDTLSNKYSSPFTTSFSGSTTRLNSDPVYESKYTPRSSYGSSIYSSSKYTSGSSSRGYGGNMLNRYSSMENLGLSSDMKSGSFRGSSSDLSLAVSSRDEVRKLEDKIRELESKVKEVTQENQEYVSIVQELSRSYPNDDHLREIKRKVTSKIAESIIMNRKENVKVARIEPFSNDKEDSINVKYDFTDGKSIPENYNTKDADLTYDIHVNVVRNIKDKSNLIEFSPSTPENVANFEISTADTNSLSAEVFDELEKRDTLVESLKPKNTRPQTWYGVSSKTPEYESSNHRHSQNDHPRRASELGRLDLNSLKADEVVFSKKSSLTLPDWMKLKRKSTSRSNQSNRFVKEVIQ